MSLISIFVVDVECDQSWNPLLVCPQVSRLAGVLVKNGVQRGDLVVIYMPMVPQAMIAMLACARIGAPHSLIFGGFASRELSVRIDHAKVRKKFPISILLRPTLPDANTHSSAQDDRHGLVWHRAGPAGGVHPSGPEGPGAELPQTLQDPHLQQAQHGRSPKRR